MPAVTVEIARFVDDHQPGFVECVLVDAAGTKHTFIEKGPVVGAANLTATSVYPQFGSIACEVHDEWQSTDGTSLARISTEQPWGVESQNGHAVFVVAKSQLQHSE